jgi:hypothetical protein
MAAAGQPRYTSPERDEDRKLTLDAGKDVLLCNIYDETEKKAHYKMGMRVAFNVTS